MMPTARPPSTACAACSSTPESTPPEQATATPFSSPRMPWSASMRRLYERPVKGLPRSRAVGGPERDCRGAGAGPRQPVLLDVAR